MERSRRMFLKSAAMPAATVAVAAIATAGIAGPKYGLIGWDRDGINGNEEFAHKLRVHNGVTGEEIKHVKWIDDRDNKLCTLGPKTDKGWPTNADGCLVSKIFTAQQIIIDEAAMRVTVWF